MGSAEYFSQLVAMGNQIAQIVGRQDSVKCALGGIQDGFQRAALRDDAFVFDAVKTLDKRGV